MATPTDSVIVAINAANTRLNGKVETLQAIGGQLVGNTNSFSQQVVNDAWRKLQAKAADHRFSELQTEVVFSNVPMIATTDPIAHVYIDHLGYYNGSTTVGAPILPATLLRPYEVSERANGTAALFTVLDPLLYSLPHVVKANWNRQWLWRNKRLYMPGALVATDLAVVYAQLLADFVDDANPWFTQTIPILNVIDPLADYICREIYISRGDMDAAAAAQASAEAGVALVAGQDSIGPSSTQKAAEFGKMSDRFTPGSQGGG